MGQQYCHSSLKSPRSIRVLHLNSSDSATQPLGCSLEEISLDNVPEYDALSYSWDAQTASEAVDCDGKILNITPNCVAALRQLRRKKAKRTMWIDSICIDQTSVNERNQQVELMGEVYQRAKNVIVWLGEVDAKSRAALKWLGEIGNLAQWGVGTVGSGELFKKANQKVEQMMKEIKDGADDPVAPIFERSWFRRMWTVQESTLPRAENVLVYCGDAWIPWYSIMIAVQAFEHCDYEHAKWWGPMKLQRHIGTLLMVEGRYNDERTYIPPPPLVVYPLLKHARQKASTDPKDKVLALYGVFKELKVSFPVPDYRKSVEDIYLEATVAGIKHDKKLFILYEVSSEIRNPRLPSWVPDWSVPGYLESDSRFPVYGPRGRFHATKSSDPFWTFSSDSKCLTLRGIVLDVISIRSGFLDIHPEQLRIALSQGNDSFLQLFYGACKTLKEWAELSANCDPYPNGESTQKAFQRTVVYDSAMYNEMAADGKFESWLYLIMMTGFLGVANPGMPEELLSMLALGRGLASEIHKAVLAMSCKKCFFITQNGRFGTAPEQIQVGDRVVLISGLQMPFILRPVGKVFHMITHGYLHGVMHGESWPANGSDLIDIVVV